MNQLDGIDGKSAKIMTIVTSNHADRINPAMRRPGRIDLVLEVQPPDEETVGVMIREFAGDMLDKKADISEAQKILAGEVPARVREVVGRARLESLRRTGNLNSEFTAADLAAVAKEVKAESRLFQPHTGNETLLASRVVLAEALHGAADALRETAGKNGHAPTTAVAASSPGNNRTVAAARA